tara:strand:+ start:5998 stop:6231 length:234 start_codon:yes stop_codon:yes gene_type:complete
MNVIRSRYADGITTHYAYPSTKRELRALLVDFLGVREDLEDLVAVIGKSLKYHQTIIFPLNNDPADLEDLILKRGTK